MILYAYFIEPFIFVENENLKQNTYGTESNVTRNGQCELLGR